MADTLKWMVLLAAVMVVVLLVIAMLAVMVVRRVFRVARPRILHRPAPTAAMSPHMRSVAGGVAPADLLLPLRALLPGPTRGITAMRWELKRDADAAARAVAAGLAAGRPVEQLRPAARRVTGVASEICLDLAVIGSEPDRGVRDALLTEQTDRIQALRRACAQIRRGVLLAADSSTATLPRYLLDDLDEEIDRLRLCAEAYHHLTNHAPARRLHTHLR